jgi:hypothetical protein
MTGMEPIQELRRLDSPFPLPQSIAWDGTAFWIGSRQTRKIYRINPVNWKVEWESAAPGVPWGITAFGGELRVLCGETAEDNRIIRRCLPGQGFDPSFALDCPDLTGSHLSFDGQRLNVSQWYPRKILALNPEGGVERTLVSPHGICGHTFVAPFFYLATTDDEESTDYWLTRIDPRSANPEVKDLARIPFAARGLAFDGSQFWTNHRERNQTVAFARAD